MKDERRASPAEVPLTILLIAPYFGGSHRAWAEGYACHSAHSIELLTLPARYWKWRMHGAAATLAGTLHERHRLGHPRPDVVLATDMVNLPVLLGLARAELAGVPVALYCHENQLTYPLQPGEKRDLAYPMTNWLSMLAADRVLFNSHFHLDSWFAELPNLLKHFPDCSHLPYVPAVRAKSVVLPVGLDLEALDAASPGALGEGRPACEPGRPPLVLWNQRWEYDKDPETFFRALDELVSAGTRFRVAFAGENVRQQADDFEAARHRLGSRVVHFGRADAAEYRQLLWNADIVVSTAIHEFFGIAIAEAGYCGALPILPDRLVYPELLPAALHARCLYRDRQGLVERMRWALSHPSEARELAGVLRPTLTRFGWAEMAPRYDAILASLGSGAYSIQARGEIVQ